MSETDLAFRFIHKLRSNSPAPCLRINAQMFDAVLRDMDDAKRYVADDSYEKMRPRAFGVRSSGVNRREHLDGLEWQFRGPGNQP